MDDTKGHRVTIAALRFIWGTTPLEFVSNYTLRSSRRRPFREESPKMYLARGNYVRVAYKITTVVHHKRMSTWRGRYTERHHEFIRWREGGAGERDASVISRVILRGFLVGPSKYEYRDLIRTQNAYPKCSQSDVKLQLLYLTIKMGKHPRITVIFQVNLMISTEAFR